MHRSGLILTPVDYLLAPTRRRRRAAVRGPRRRSALGIPTATLRSWNQRYGVGPSDHRPGSHRLYSENDIAIVKRMHELIAQGASPRSAARAATDASGRPAVTLPGLLAAAFDLDVVTVGLLLDRHLRHFGVVATWDELIRPAFAVIVDRQAEGEECVDVEHTLSWAVSRYLYRLPIGEPDATDDRSFLYATGDAHPRA